MIPIQIAIRKNGAAISESICRYGIIIQKISADCCKTASNSSTDRIALTGSIVTNKISRNVCRCVLILSRNGTADRISPVTFAENVIVDKICGNIAGFIIPS